MTVTVFLLCSREEWAWSNKNERVGGWYGCGGGGVSKGRWKLWHKTTTRELFRLLRVVVGVSCEWWWWWVCVFVNDFFVILPSSLFGSVVASLFPTTRVVSYKWYIVVYYFAGGLLLLIMQMTRNDRFKFWINHHLPRISHNPSNCSWLLHPSPHQTQTVSID